MKPLKLEAAYKDYLWGGTKLRTVYGKKTDITPVAESWELSCHKDGYSIIANGDDKGKTLNEYIKNNPAVLGTYATSGELPILIKLIDAQDNLSVQVHPDNEQAKAWEGQNGKTEMWYVVDAEKDAKITYGVREDTTKDVLKKAIINKTVENLLDCVPSKKGDVFFVDAGTIHAIGKGNLIAEIQQNSNVTYRLYDYGRIGKDGKERELHIEKGIEASKLNRIKPRQIPECSDGTRLLGSCEYFAVKEIKLKGEKTFFADEKSYHALIVTEGSIELAGSDFSEIINAGETVFIPATLGEYKMKGNATVLSTTSQPKYYIGIDLGGTNIAAAVVDENGVIYGRAKRKTIASRPHNEILDDMAACAKDAAEATGISFDDIEAVGVGCPGSIDKAKGIVEYSNNLNFNDVHIVEYLEKALNKKIYIDNDANAAAWGEYFAGGGKDKNSMVLLTLGTGVGGGVIENGKMLYGAYGKGAELGHTMLIYNGEKCTCGRKGCFEAYASATALIRQTKAAMKQDRKSEMWKLCDNKLSNVSGRTAFMAKDATAKKVVKDYLDYLSAGVIDMINIFQPEILCIGGGISHEGEKILKPIRKAVKNLSYARFGEKQSEVALAELGNDAGIIGAALLWKTK